MIKWVNLWSSSEILTKYPIDVNELFALYKYLPFQCLVITTVSFLNFTQYYLGKSSKSLPFFKGSGVFNRVKPGPSLIHFFPVGMTSWQCSFSFAFKGKMLRYMYWESVILQLLLMMQFTNCLQLVLNFLFPLTLLSCRFSS